MALGCGVEPRESAPSALVSVDDADGWFWAIRAYPNGIPRGARTETLRVIEGLEAGGRSTLPTPGVAREALSQTIPGPRSIFGRTWFPVGPAGINDVLRFGEVSGRATAVAVNPARTTELWLGTATGGVWHTIDAGRTWTPLTDGARSLAVGVIVTEGCNLDGCGRIWVGTGEASLRRDTYFGAGLLLLTPFEFGAYTVTPIGEELFAGGSINNIVLGARGADGLATELMVTVSRGVSANATHSTVNSPEPAGLFGIHHYTFGSTPTIGTWARLSVPGTETPLPFEGLPVRRVPTDLESLEPDNLDHLLAGFVGTGIFEFDVATGLWCPLNPGVIADPSCPPADPSLPTPAADPMVFPGFDHIELAVVPSEPRIVYALFGQSSNRFADPGNATLFRRETDGSWRQVRIFTGSLSRYTNALTVDPRDPNICYVGLQRAFRVDASAPTSTSTPILMNIHPDHHALTFAERVPGDPSAGYLFYNASDGGFAVSEVGGIPDLTDLAAGTPRNAGLQIVQMHTIAGHRDTPILIGGTQDNDCIRFDLGGSWPTMFGITADCGFTAIDIDNSRIAFSAFQRFLPFRWPDLDTMGGRIHIDRGIDISLHNERVAFYAPLVQDPTEGTPEVNAIYFGSVVLDRSLDRGDTWTTVSPEIDPGGTIFPAAVT